MEKQLNKYRKSELVSIITQVCTISKEAAKLLINRLEGDLKELKLIIKNS